MGEGEAIYALGEREPSVADDAWVAPGAQLIGSVTLGARASVWFNAVLRADIDSIAVGEGSNIQDGSILHVDDGFPLTVGSNVTVGHKVMLHGCTIGDGALIGINAVVLNGAHIGARSLVGANALVTEGKLFPPRSLILGAPAKVVRELSDKELELLDEAADHYREAAARYRKELRKL